MHVRTRTIFEIFKKIYEFMNLKTKDLSFFHRNLKRVVKMKLSLVKKIEQYEENVVNPNKVS